MLEQILADMHIDSELLAELDEEQKQLLFLKMRQEQVRRWTVWQANETESQSLDPFKPLRPRRPGKHKVVFVNGPDGKPTVSVMGEPPAPDVATNGAEKTTGFDHVILRKTASGNEMAPATETKTRAAAGSTTTVAPPQSANRNKTTDQPSVVLEEVQRFESAWLDQLKISKAHDDSRRFMARRVRESADENLQRVINIVKTESIVLRTMKYSLPNTKLRTGKPAGRSDLVKWFREAETVRNAGIDPSTQKLATWFHGIIGRDEAEQLLSACGEGAFLVRVSDKIWGYVISYRCAGNDQYKHFVIDASGDIGYRFFGANHRVYSTLADMIDFYTETPISVTGLETLRFPCGQSTDTPDYQELFESPSPLDEVSHL